MNLCQDLSSLATAEHDVLPAVLLRGLELKAGAKDVERGADMFMRALSIKTTCRYNLVAFDGRVT